MRTNGAIKTEGNLLYSKKSISDLNEDIRKFDQVTRIDDRMHDSMEGISRTVMLDRYAFKDTSKRTLKEGDFVVVTVKHDPNFPTKGFGYVNEIDWSGKTVTVEVEEQFKAMVEEPDGLIKRTIDEIDKPLELYLEQIADRVARGLSEVEPTDFERNKVYKEFKEVLEIKDVVPAGRVLSGAGTGAEVTYFNCYVMPFPQDSRQGLSKHREQVMEIMSRGGGVGTNGSTLRPRNAAAKGVNGKSSGSVSWLDDLAKLTHLVEQGGSRRGAQMIMLDDWHPDVIEFIVSKMQNPDILRYIKAITKSETIATMCERKLKFNPISEYEKELAESAVKNELFFSKDVVKKSKKLLKDGGRYEVNNPEFLSGANISIALTEEFMDAIEKDEDHVLRFPDVGGYDKEQMAEYNQEWPEIGDVREWENRGYAVKEYEKISAKDLWDLINICATYSAEPGIFFIDNANKMTNASSYRKKVVGVNPCGEQPLAPYSVCNLAAINLANMSKDGSLDVERLKKAVESGVKLQNNVIDATPYFLEENEKQAKGERRVGLGVMGLHDLLIKTGNRYGSEDGNTMVDKVFEIIATTAYRTSIEMAKKNGSFPFLVGENESETMDLRKRFINSGYMKGMPEDIREGVLQNGIRNSHLLTVAPTGSTGTMIGCSTGLEPYFSFSYFRSGRLGDMIEVKAEIAQDWLTENGKESLEELPEYFVSAMELTPEEHTEVQCIIQKWIDSSLSKTVNAPKGYSVEQVKNVYENLYKGGAKGGTVYVDGSRGFQVLNLIEEGEEEEEEEEEEEKEETLNAKSSLGLKVGDVCPTCEKGEVVDAGGCNTCNNCGSQLKCGI